jgi:hypothetical protein
VVGSLAVGVPGWPTVGRGFDATPVVVLLATFAVAAFVLRIPITPRTTLWTGVVGVALGLIAASFDAVSVVSSAVLVAVLVAVVSKRNASAPDRRSRD